MTYRLTISDIEEVALSNFLIADLHTDHYEDDILKMKWYVNITVKFTNR
ncbi:hypothetical protein T12_8891 [Trichinella patagoniensis]|uniref:Uncharacterized protein n=1 Tax=Trichinella patagoniensis TaxID=990121 RepID=A0A0V0YRA2_9BILA|nr:hypothetical protein T12_8891 [Trichinella patagoniensis]